MIGEKRLLSYFKNLEDTYNSILVKIESAHSLSGLLKSACVSLSETDDIHTAWIIPSAEKSLLVGTIVRDDKSSDDCIPSTITEAVFSASRIVWSRDKDCNLMVMRISCENHVYGVLCVKAKIGIREKAFESLLTSIVLALGAKIRLFELENVRESNNYELLDSLNAAAFVVDSDWKIIFCNSAAEILMGFRKEEIAGSAASDLFVDQAKNYFSEHVTEPMKMMGKVTVEAKLKRKDSPSFSASVHASVLRDRENGLWAAVFTVTDASREKQLEEKAQEMDRRIQQSQKMDALGQLAGGIAHDFNNQLAGILGYAEMMYLQLRDDETLGIYTQRIIQAAECSRDLTRQLLSFTHIGEIEKRPVDIHSIIDDVINVLSRTIDRRIVLRKELKARNAVVVGNSGQIESALLNLGLNARDALPEGGEIVFTTRQERLRESDCNRYPDQPQPGKYVEISVSDNGTGIPPELLTRIFEPFFTTKDVSEGTGLGLSAFTSMTRNHNGVFFVDSEMGKGSVFTTLLPIYQNAEEPKKREPVSDLVHGKGTILVVDDEQLVRSLLADWLDYLGYETILCCNGTEALEKYRNKGGNIDLVMMDVMMPNINGLETFRQLKAMNDSVRVLFLTGYSDNRNFQDILKEGALGILRKPVNISQLSHTLASTMASAKKGS